MLKSAKITQAVSILLIVAIALAGAAVLAYSTSMGPAVGGDATIFLTAARNLTEGKGLGFFDPSGKFVLIPYSAPFYPIALAGLSLTGFPLLDIARWFNVALLACTILVTGLGFFYFTRSLFVAIFLSLLVAVSPVVLSTHVWAMSEPLFLFSGVSSLLLLLRYLERPSPGWLVGSAILCAICCLTRYIGVAFALTAGLALLLINSRPVRYRWLDDIIYVVIVALPSVIWLAYDIAQTGTVASRRSQPLAALWHRFLALRAPIMDTIVSWLPYSATLTRKINPPYSYVLEMILAVAVLAIAALIFIRLRQIHKGSWLQVPGVRLMIVALAFLVIYGLIVIEVWVFTYPPITLSDRLLLPLQFMGFVAAAIFCALGFKAFPARKVWLAIPVTLVALAFLASYSTRTRLAAMEYHHNGLGFTGAYWRSSPTLKAVKQLPPTTPIITNNITAMMFFFDRPAYAIQELYLVKPLTTYTKFGDGLDDPAQLVFRQEKGALVLFPDALQDFTNLYGSKAAERMAAFTRGLYPYFQGDGQIYFYNPPNP